MNILESNPDSLVEVAAEKVLAWLANMLFYSMELDFVVLNN